MNNAPASPAPAKSMALFFVIVFVISLPIYALAFLVPQEMTMLVGLILTIAPITSALFLTYRENGSDGAKRLLKRTFDYKRISNKFWLIPILFFWPLIFIIASAIMTYMKETAPDSLFPIGAVPILFVLFFIFASFEEEGWMGYAYEPMEKRWNALKASLILGILWAIWHLPLYWQNGQDPLWIAGQIVSLVAIRILIVFLFNNTGKSIFATILFHTVYNVCTITFTNFYTSTGHLITTILIIIAALVVTLLWDADTLTLFRFRKHKLGVE